MLDVIQFVICYDFILVLINVNRFRTIIKSHRQHNKDIWNEVYTKI